MSAEPSVFRLVDIGRKEAEPAPARGDVPHQAPVGRPDFRLTGAGRKAKDLIGLLIAHGARARRSARPRCRVLLEVVTPAGSPAVEISFD